MNTQSEQLILLSKIERYRTNHVLHVVLCIVFLLIFPPLAIVWVLVWVLCAISNGIERAQLERKLRKL